MSGLGRLMLPILEAVLGVRKAMLGGYVVHPGLWKTHFAALGGHLVAKSAAKSQHERPKTEISSTCSFSIGFLDGFWSMGFRLQRRL